MDLSRNRHPGRPGVAVRRAAQRPALRGAPQRRTAGPGLDPRAGRRRLAATSATASSGFAHLIEHLTFRQSKYLGDGEAIHYFQRLGASVRLRYQRDHHPDADGLQARLAQRRGNHARRQHQAGLGHDPRAGAERGQPRRRPADRARRAARATAGPSSASASRSLQVFYAGQQLADRSPIGKVETLQGATPAAVQAFHNRWYRPDKTVVVIAGDADPARMAALVEQLFRRLAAVARKDPRTRFRQSRGAARCRPGQPGRRDPGGGRAGPAARRSPMW